MADAEISLQPFHAAMADLTAWLETAGARGMIIGGVAVALLGRPRITRDLDALVLVDDQKLQEFVEAGKQIGFVSRFSDPVPFARQTHIFAMRHVPSQITVDIALGSLPFEEDAIANSQRIQIADFQVAIPRPEDLILMKAVAHRENDLADIRGIVARQDKLDERYLRKRAQEFAAMLEQPEIQTFIEQQLKRST